MRFAYGGTRFVILTGTLAIKIARIRPIRMALQLYRRSKAGTVSAGLSQFHGNKLIAGLKYFLNGITSNRIEARLSKECPDAHVAPTLFSLFGLVNVQLRGDVVEPGELPQCPYRNISAMSHVYPELADLDQVKQFARFGDKILLIDTGGMIVAKEIARYHGKSLSQRAPVFDFA